MADFFDKLKDTINKGVETATAFTQDLIDTTKISSQINTLKMQQKDAFLELGKVTYEMNQIGNIEVAALQEKCVEIKNLGEQIKTLEGSLEQHQNKPDEAPPAPSASKKCECGADVAAGIKFCGSCGKKIEQIQ